MAQNNPNINAERIKGHLDLNAATSVSASFRIRPGSNVSSPNTGDMWIYNNQLKIQDIGLKMSFERIFEFGTSSGGQYNFGSVNNTNPRVFNLYRNQNTATGISLENNNTGVSSAVDINFFNSSATAQSNIRRHASSYTGNLNGTSIAIANTFAISNTHASVVSSTLIFTSNAIIATLGSTSTNIGTRLDAVGFRVGQISTLHTTNTNIFAIIGNPGNNVTFNGDRLTVAGLGFPLTINSTNSNTLKIALQDNGTTRGYFGSGSGIPLNVGDLSGNIIWTIINSGNMYVGGGIQTPSARLHIAAGTTSAGTAPIKLTSGSLMTAAEAGGIEFLTDKLYATITTGAARKELTLNDSALTSGRIPFTTTNGRLLDSSNLTYSTNVILTGNTVLDLEYRAINSNVSGQANFTAENNAGNFGRFLKYSSAHGTYKTFVANDSGFYNSSGGGDISLLNDNPAGTIKLTTGGASSSQLTVNSTGTIILSSLAGTGSRLVQADSTGLLSATEVVPSSGTYTPTATNVTNITSSTSNKASYIRVGSVVTVTGTITITNTLAVVSQVDVALPVPSNLGVASDLNGVGTTDTTASTNIYVKGDVTNDRASIYFTSVGVGQTSTIYYHFTYNII